MAYTDNSIKPLRHIGRQRWAHSKIGPFLDPHAVVTGTFLTTPTEAEVVTGGQTVIITLSGATWAASGTAFDGQRQNIINGLSSWESEAGGLATVKAAAVVTNVVRTSATIVTITLPATAGYSITANETWRFKVPPTALFKRGGRNEARAAVAVTVVAA